MIGGRRRITDSGGDSVWPGFVDALSTLLLVMMFLISLFALAQFFLGQALSGREQALAELRGQVAQLSNMLKMERQANDELRRSMADLSAALESANDERDTLSGKLGETRDALETAREQLETVQQERDRLATNLEETRAERDNAQAQLSEEERLSARAQKEVSRLRRNLDALRDKLSRLQAALEASEARDKRNQAVIVNLGKRLNQALASKVEELADYRSEFFGRLKKALSSRPEIRVEGDRFVFASELLFASGSAELGPEGRAEMRRFADTLKTIAAEIPDDLNWILRVDGHTDKRPISSPRFANNWELSAARAISVVQFLIDQGVAPDRLAATGFGAHQPIDPADNALAYARNRRIEMRLTQR
ncbi:peptidoglycan -binding protein [Yunchengibacter salinarum]|uniref:peptidoglycan -binding protein n=1 Tax=Yunchengibacter salinarum TaxID=3133399 RepID=UPI0035B65762